MDLHIEQTRELRGQMGTDRGILKGLLIEYYSDDEDKCDEMIRLALISQSSVLRESEYHHETKGTYLITITYDLDGLWTFFPMMGRFEDENGNPV